MLRHFQCETCAHADCALAFARAPQRVTSEERAYTQQVHFRYEAAAPPGLYDEPTIRVAEVQRVRHDVPDCLGPLAEALVRPS